jgi:two-component system phosphate regulon response regulator PhoB
VPSALVVDDDPDIGSVIVFMLRRAGFEVRMEIDGDSGLVAAIEMRPDVVLLDWMMPHMSGIEVCRALRSNAELRSTTVIMLTAMAQESDARQGARAGADDYIVKPFSPRELVDRVQTALARTRSR